MASKYAPLTEWLQKCGQDTVRLTFSELDEIISIPLSAYKDRPAWANSKASGSPFQKGWLNAGYVVSAIDMKAGWVKFSKGEPQQRGTPSITNTFSGHLDEDGLAAAIQKGYDCYDEIRRDPNHRYLSGSIAIRFSGSTRKTRTASTPTHCASTLHGIWPVGGCSTTHS